MPTDKSIPDLTDGSAAQSTDIFPVSRSPHGATDNRKLTLAAVETLLAPIQLGGKTSSIANLTDPFPTGLAATDVFPVEVAPFGAGQTHKFPISAIRGFINQYHGYTDYLTAAATDAIPAARSPYAITDFGFITPAYLHTYHQGLFDSRYALTGAAPNAHKTSHQDGGSDEISVQGLSGLLADAQTPLAHKTSHQDGGSDELSVQGLSGLLADAQTPLAHATSHKNGGSDEVATATAAANAIPKAGSGGTLDIAWLPTGSTSTTVCIGNDSRLSDARTPSAHATSHKNGGSDEVATATAAANAIPKAGAGGTLDIAWLPTGSTSSTVCIGNDSRLSDSRTPTAHATSHKSGGSDAVKLDELAAPTDVTTLNVSSTLHGLCPKSPADATRFLNGAATPAFAQVKDSDLVFTDVTTNNATTSQHGFLKKLSGNATDYMDGTGNWSTVSAGVASSRTLNTTSPITGGGDLSADRTFALDFTVLYTYTGNGIGTTATDRIQLSNTTAAAVNAQQWSPALRFTGQGWKTAATAASQAVDWRIYLTPVQASAAPTASLLFDYSVNGGAFATKHTFNSDGTYTAVGNIQAGNGTVSVPAFRFATGSSSGIFWNGSGWMGLVYNGGEVASVLSTGLAVNATYRLDTPSIIVGSGATVTKILSAAATLDFGSTAAQADTDLTITVTGAAAGDAVFLAVPNGSVLAGGCYTAWVSATNTVTVRFSNYSSGALDPASGSFRVAVVRLS